MACRDSRAARQPESGGTQGGAKPRVVAGWIAHRLFRPERLHLDAASCVRPDGSPVKMPPIRTDRDGERLRFLPNGRALGYMRGDGAPDGKQIVFDRQRENSAVVLIDLREKL